MAKYRIFNATRSAVINTIVADEAFVAANYAEYELIPEPPAITAVYQVTAGQLLSLFRGDTPVDQPSAYSGVYRAAHAATTPDDVALEFIERMRMPEGDTIDLFEIEPALDYFVTSGFITQADKDRIMQGWEP